MGGGGLSNVSVRKRKIQHEDDQPCKHEYFIHGKRISDQTVSLGGKVVVRTAAHYYFRGGGGGGNRERKN